MSKMLSCLVLVTLYLACISTAPINDLYNFLNAICILKLIVPTQTLLYVRAERLCTSGSRSRLITNSTLAKTLVCNVSVESICHET